MTGLHASRGLTPTLTVTLLVTLTWLNSARGEVRVHSGNHWLGGFSGELSFTVPVDENGWKIHVIFSQPVASLAVWEEEQQRVNDREFYLSNKEWNIHLTAGATLSLRFNGATPGQDIHPDICAYIVGVDPDDACDPKTTTTTTTAATTTTTTTTITSATGTISTTSSASSPSSSSSANDSLTTTSTNVSVGNSTTQAVPISSQGMPVSTQGGPISSQGVPISSQGVSISTQGMPVSTQGVPIHTFSSTTGAPVPMSSYSTQTKAVPPRLPSTTGAPVPMSSQSQTNSVPPRMPSTTGAPVPMSTQSQANSVPPRMPSTTGAPVPMSTQSQTDIVPSRMPSTTGAPRDIVTPGLPSKTGAPVPMSTVVTNSPTNIVTPGLPSTSKSQTNIVTPGLPSTIKSQTTVVTPGLPSTSKSQTTIVTPGLPSTIKSQTTVVTPGLPSTIKSQTTVVTPGLPSTSKSQTTVVTPGLPSTSKSQTTIVTPGLPSTIKSQTTVVTPGLPSTIKSQTTVVTPGLPSTIKSQTTVVTPGLPSTSKSQTTVVTPGLPSTSKSQTTVVTPGLPSTSKSQTTVVTPGLPSTSKSQTTVVTPGLPSTSKSQTTVVTPGLPSTSKSQTTIVTPGLPSTSKSQTTIVTPGLPSTIKSQTTVVTPGLPSTIKSQTTIVTPGLPSTSKSQTNIVTPGLPSTIKSQTNIVTPGLPSTSKSQTNIVTPGLPSTSKSQTTVVTPGLPSTIKSQTNIVTPGLPSTSKSQTTVATEPSFTLQPTTQVVGGSSTKNYSEALRLSQLFYYAQRSGRLPADNPVPWRNDSALGDCVLGGWYDAGDHVKFGFPMAGALTVLLWGGHTFRQGYDQAGELDTFYDTVRWGLDYLLDAWNPFTEELVVQIGDGDVDHQFWGRPEDMTMPRPCVRIGPGRPGSDVAAETAAALAAGSLVFRDKGETRYAAELLEAAESLYTFASENRGKFSDNPPVTNEWGYSSSDERDEMCEASAWLYKATGDEEYLVHAKQEHQGTVPEEYDWNNKIAACQLLLWEATFHDSYRRDVKNFLQSWQPGGDKLYSPCGYAWGNATYWGSARHVSNVAFLALVAAEDGINQAENRKWAAEQMNYLLGDNPHDGGCFSYEIGYGAKYPLHPHHRAASCPLPPSPCSEAVNLHSAAASPHVLLGGLVGGPIANDGYNDTREDYVHNEVALDYNAGFQSALAGLNQLVAKGHFPVTSNKCPCLNRNAASGNPPRNNPPLIG